MRFDRSCTGKGTIVSAFWRKGTMRRRGDARKDRHIEPIQELFDKLLRCGLIEVLLALCRPENYRVKRVCTIRR
jgi:hypothetical protein